MSEEVINNEEVAVKAKKKLKPWQIAVIVVSSIVFLALCGVGGFLIWMFTQPPVDPGVLVNVELKVDMADRYYVGTAGDVLLKEAFPEAKDIKVKSGNSKITNDVLKVADEEKFVLTVDGKDINVNVIKDAVNVSTYDELFNAAKDNKAICVHADKLVMKVYAEDTDGSAKDSTIMLKNDFYGNGVKIDANAVVKSAGNSDNKVWGRAGSVAIKVESNEKVIVRDLQVTGKEYTEGDDIKAYMNYGPLLSIGSKNTNGGDNSTTKTNAEVYNCIVERGAKNLCIENADVLVQDCVVKEASDSAISIGTYANSKSNITLRDNVIANGLAGGVVIYCFDKDLTPENADNSWNTINIEGKLDIYNWKQEDALVFVPDTELLNPPILVQLGGAINSIVTGELGGPDKHIDKKVPGKAIDEKGETYDTFFIHFAIVKIYTAGVAGVKEKGNQSVVNGYENVGYRMENMPFPTGGLWGGVIPNFIQSAVIYGYFNNGKDRVQVGQTLNESDLLAGKFIVLNADELKK